MMMRAHTAGRAAWWLAMTLAATCCAAQTSQMPTGSGAPAAGTAAPTTGPQNAGSTASQMPGSSAQQGPVTTTTGADKSGPAHLEQKPSTPGKNKLAPDDGVLTFLP